MWRFREARDVIESCILLAIVALVVGLFVAGILPYHASSTAPECRSVPARYGGVECPEPAAHFRIDSGELEWE